VNTFEKESDSNIKVGEKESGAKKCIPSFQFCKLESHLQERKRSTAIFRA